MCNWFTNAFPSNWAREQREWNQKRNSRISQASINVIKNKDVKFLSEKSRPKDLSIGKKSTRVIKKIIHPPPAALNYMLQIKVIAVNVQSLPLNTWQGVKKRHQLNRILQLVHIVQQHKAWGSASDAELYVCYFNNNIILYHDLLPSSKRGSRGKSDYASTIVKQSHLSQYTRYSSLPTELCKGIPPLARWYATIAWKGGPNEHRNEATMTTSYSIIYIAPGLSTPSYRLRISAQPSPSSLCCPSPPSRHPSNLTSVYLVINTL